MFLPLFFGPRWVASLLCLPCLFLLLLGGVARAHDPFESTVVSRLQHGRLEVTVTMTMEMGSALLSDPANPEAAGLSAQTFEQNRELLQARALSLYDVVDGQVTLTAQKASVRMTPEGGHLEILLVYPPPATWPLHVRARPVERVPSSYSVAVDVFDQDENLLGRKLMNLRDPSTTDLVVQSATAIIPTATPGWMAPVATPAPVVAPPAPPWPWVEISIAVLVGGAALALAPRLFKKPPGAST